MRAKKAILHFNIFLAVLLTVAGSSVSIYKTYCTCEDVEKTSIILAEYCCANSHSACDQEIPSDAQIGHECCSKDFKVLKTDIYEYAGNNYRPLPQPTHSTSILNIKNIHQKEIKNQNAILEFPPPFLNLQLLKVIAHHQIRIPSEEDIIG